MPMYHAFGVAGKRADNGSVWAEMTGENKECSMIKLRIILDSNPIFVVFFI